MITEQNILDAIEQFEFKSLISFMTKKDFYYYGYDDEKDPIFRNDYSWVMTYSDYPDYLFIKDELPLDTQIKAWLFEIGVKK